MDHKALSLTKKLDGGYLHIKKRDSNVKKRVHKGGYSNYLKRTNGSEKTAQKGGVHNNTDKQKVVAIKLGGSKKKSPRKSPRKTKPEVKGIPNIIPKKVVNNPIPMKAQPKSRSKIPVVMPKTNTPLQKKQIIRRHRKTNGRSLTKRRNHNLRGGKRISVSKVRKLSNKDVQSIQSKLKEIKKKSTEDIKKELNKEGIQVSGKSPSILKDIYMYSKLCGINIKRE